VLGKYNPSLVLDSVTLTGSGDIRKNGATEEVIAAVSAINSFAIVMGIVESLSIDSVSGLILDVALVKIDAEGVVIVGSSNPKCEAQQCAH
jgi:predicted hydrolase (HD superfamily)